MGYTSVFIQNASGLLLGEMPSWPWEYWRWYKYVYDREKDLSNNVAEDVEQARKMLANYFIKGKGELVLWECEIEGNEAIIIKCTGLHAAPPFAEYHIIEIANRLEIPGKLGEYSVIGIASNAFYHTYHGNEYEDLESVIIPDGVRRIGDYAFYKCCGLKSITIPDSVTMMGNAVFRECNSLVEVRTPAGAKHIGDYAFAGCSGLHKVTIPAGVESIGESAFAGCSALTHITIPDRVKDIDCDAFSGCTSLTNVIIPKGVTDIGPGTFENCSSLNSVTIPDSVTTIDYLAFYGCDHVVLSVKEGSFAEQFAQKYGLQYTLLQKAENLVVVSEENLIRNAFPLKLEPVIAQRNAANEAEHRHLTSLIVPILAAADNKIMVINKYKKNIAKYPNKVFPPRCYDILGGHAVRESIPENELEKGEVSEESVAAQAFREFSEELHGPQAFDVRDLRFIGFYPYPQLEGEGPVTNKECTAVFAILLSEEEAGYAAQDNVGEEDISLDCEGVSYAELQRKWNEREKNKEHYRMEDGLGRILAKDDLPARIAKLRLPGKNGPITIL